LAIVPKLLQMIH